MADDITMVPTDSILSKETVIENLKNLIFGENGFEKFTAEERDTIDYAIKYLECDELKSDENILRRLKKAFDADSVGIEVNHVSAEDCRGSYHIIIYNGKLPLKNQKI